jgi:hypothetical protein
MTSLHKRALVIAGLHFLFTLTIMIFGLATMWADAATHNTKTGWDEYLFYTLQPLWFLMTKLRADVPLGPALLSVVICSVAYGYLIASLLARLFRSNPPNREGRDT